MKEKKSVIIQTRVTETERDQLAASAEAQGIKMSALLRKGSRLTALAHSSMWKAAEFMSERSGVPVWDVVFIAVSDLYVNFSSEEMLFLEPKAIDRLRKLYLLYLRDQEGFLTKLSKERTKEFEATRASERNL